MKSVVELRFFLGRAMRAQDFPAAKSFAKALSDRYLQSGATCVAEKYSSLFPCSEANSNALVEVENWSGLTGLERKLLRFVLDPKDKFEISDHLYPDEKNPFASENRIKNLIFRIRSKFPEAILFENGKYRTNRR